MASTEQIAKDYYDKGINYLLSSNLDTGIENLKMAKSFYEELNDSTMYLNTLRALCIGYSALGNDSRMLQNILTALNYCDNNGICGAKHMFYTVICDRYMKLNDYDNAINYGLLAVQDIKDHGEEFDNSPTTFMVAFLNLAISYLQTQQAGEAETAYACAKEIAMKNDIHQHDFSFAVTEARLHHAKGDLQYVLDNLDELINFVRNIDMLVQDYVQDVLYLVELFCQMDLYDKAILLVQNIDYTALSNEDYRLRIEAAKLFMYIYKKMGDKKKYRTACVQYAECDMAFKTKESEKHLLDMDTDIALSIAATPFDLI